MNQNGQSNDMLKSIMQWVLIPVLTALLGITGTYMAQVNDMRQIQATQGIKLTVTEKAIDNEREDRLAANRELRAITEERMKNVVILMEALLKQNTEVITLFRVQQQVVR